MNYNKVKSVFLEKKGMHGKSKSGLSKILVSQSCLFIHIHIYLFIFFKFNLIHHLIFLRYGDSLTHYIFYENIISNLFNFCAEQR